MGCLLNMVTVRDMLLPMRDSGAALLRYTDGQCRIQIGTAYAAQAMMSGVPCFQETANRGL